MSIRINDDGIIETDRQLIMMLTPKNTTKWSTMKTIIIHYTAGSTAKSSADWLFRPDVKASAHVVIGEEGEIYQIVSFNNIAWHAGISAYGGRKGFNNFAVGLELSNPGIVTPSGDGFVTEFGKRYTADRVIKAVHRNETQPRYWVTYTEKQMQACEELCEALQAKYGITEILGHEEIAPDRKKDPGPAFPLDLFRNRILQEDPQDDRDEAILTTAKKGRVITDKLNIREGAGTNFEKVARALPLNKEVTVVGERNGWYRVKVEVEGWVNKAYIENR